MKTITKYDERGNCIYCKNPSGYEQWNKFDENNNLIYYRNSYNGECWFKYDKKYDRPIKITKQEFENIKIREYNSRTKCSRFELIEI